MASDRLGQSTAAITTRMADAQIRHAEHRALFPAPKQTAAYRNGYDSGYRAGLADVRTQAESASCRFRIYTEGKPDALAVIRDRLARYAQLGATITFGVGIWQDTLETSVTVDIIAARGDYQAIVFLSGDIKHALDQQAVIVTVEPLVSMLTV